MNVLVAGSSGLIGESLLENLRTTGNQIFRLVRRRPSSPDEVEWRPSDPGFRFPEGFGCDAVVNLAGESLAEGRWTREKKQKLKDSRILATKSLVNAMGALATRPNVFVCSSAVGFYGNRGEEVLTEASTQGTGFLAELCGGWEAEARVAATSGMRTVQLRTGLVLASKGGALEKLIPPFKAGMGGPIAGGQMWQSWIVLEDLIQIIREVMDRELYSGPVNAVSPNPIRQGQFASSLGTILRRPSFVPMPGPALRLLFGEMADEVLLTSTRVNPGKLLEQHFQFRYPDLTPALAYLL